MPVPVGEISCLRRKKLRGGAFTETRLRFGELLPVTTIKVTASAVEATSVHVLKSRVLAMDKTPVSAGPSRARSARRTFGWCTVRTTGRVSLRADAREHRDTEDLLGNFRGDLTLMSDGFEAYAKRVGVVQCLLASCWLPGVEPCTYMVDVLQRICGHCASRAVEVTLRACKTLLTDNPPRSDLTSARDPSTH